MPVRPDDEAKQRTYRRRAPKVPGTVRRRRPVLGTPGLVPFGVSSEFRAGSDSTAPELFLPLPALLLLAAVRCARARHEGTDRLL